MAVDKPFKEILNRDESVGLINENYKDQVDLLQEMANYGSNLIIRCFYSSSKEISSVIVLNVLLKHVVAMVDSAEILISQGAILAGRLPARTIFETCLYIEWILKEKTDYRAKLYYVWSLRQQRDWTMKGIEGTKEQKEFSEKLSELKEDFATHFFGKREEAKKNIETISDILKSKELRAIDELFEQNRAKRKKNYDLPWYKIDGIKSIWKMSQDLGKEMQYEILYNEFSDVTHGTVLLKHINFKNGEFSYVPIRHLENIELLFNFIMATTLNIFEKVLSYYRPAEIPNFLRKYTEEWKDRFKSIKKIQYKITIQH
jgi:hypothetical protein